MTNISVLPQWAKQVKRETISKLYSLDAAEIYDEELVDEVAYTMLARADSIIKVTKARNFIEGSLVQVVELIFSLAYGDNPDLNKNRAEWIEKLKISYVPDHIKDRE